MRTVPARDLLPSALPDGPYRYALLVDELDVPGLVCESYGVAAERPDGARAQVRHVTVSQPAALELLALLIRNQISPVHLEEIVADYLAS